MIPGLFLCCMVLYEWLSIVQTFKQQHNKSAKLLTACKMLMQLLEKKKIIHNEKNQVTTYEDVSIKSRTTFSEIFCISWYTGLIFITFLTIKGMLY